MPPIEILKVCTFTTTKNIFIKTRCESFFCDFWSCFSNLSNFILFYFHLKISFCCVEEWRCPRVGGLVGTKHRKQKRGKKNLRIKFFNEPADFFYTRKFSQEIYIFLLSAVLIWNAHFLIKNQFVSGVKVKLIWLINNWANEHAIVRA